MTKPHDIAWAKIFATYSIYDHDFDVSPYQLSANQIKSACKSFDSTGQKEPRILCKQDTRESRPQVFAEKGLFLLPTKNGQYSIIKGEGYIDIPEITTPAIPYTSKLDFKLITSEIGNSEMQHLDFAYASSVIRTFMDDSSLVLTIRGRKFTPEFKFSVSGFQLETASVQTEVDGGYEGRDKIVLIEAKNSSTRNTITRQLYYPYRQWKTHSQHKSVHLLFFEKRKNECFIWQYAFKDEFEYDSIYLVKSEKYLIESH
jgi:hypothetical protein